MHKFMKIFVNLITSFRLLFTIYLIVGFNKVSEINFLVSMILLFLTDTIDGFLARRFKVQSLFGSKMDTIADKMLVISLIVLLLKHIKIMWVLLIGELVISVINVLASFQGRKTHAAKIGKIKMWVIAIAIFLGYAYYFKYIGYTPVLVACIVTLILEILVIVSYIRFIFSQKIIKIEKKWTVKEIVYKLFDTDYYLNNKL